MIGRGLVPRHPAGFTRRWAHLAVALLVLDALLAVLSPLQRLAQPLGELPGQLHDAARLPQAVVLRHRDVAHVPHEPAAQAEEDDERAGVDQEVSVEAAVQAQVGEDPDEEEDQTDHIQRDGEEE